MVDISSVVKCIKRTLQCTEKQMIHILFKSFQESNYNSSHSEIAKTIANSAGIHVSTVYKVIGKIKSDGPPNLPKKNTNHLSVINKFNGFTISALERVKSERINELRKQYDAFLLEDKQRKDRNCIILERLDKMCFNSATVPLQIRRNILYLNHQPQVYNPPALEIGNALGNSTPINRHFTSVLPKEIVDESFMMQEISKKYILIPKLKTITLSNYNSNINNVTNDGSEWMQKYEILNELNKNDHDKLQNAEEIQKEIKQNDKEKLIIKPAREDTEKALSNFEHNKSLEKVREISILQTFHQNSANEPILHDSKCKNSEIERDINNDMTTKMLYAEDYNNSNNTIQNVIETCSNITQNDYTDVNSSYLPSNELTIFSEKCLPIQDNLFKNIENEKNAVNCVSNVNRNEPIKEIGNYYENLKEEENVQYPVDTINLSNIGLQDNININSEQYINNETVDSPYSDNPEKFRNEEIINSQPENDIEAEDVAESCGNLDLTSAIEEFDAEQRDMFYSDQAQENYEFHQSNITGSYNQDYDASNDNYQQNSEYYENVQMEQTYPVEINEHEETIERYDQNYEEQYLRYEEENNEQQESKRTQQYEQVSQDVQPQIDDIIQSETIDQTQYEQQNYDTQAFVDEQIDNEQGLVDKQILNETVLEQLQIEVKEKEQVAE